jgi:hypothetical protein
MPSRTARSETPVLGNDGVNSDALWSEAYYAHLTLATTRTGMESPA